MTHQGELHRYIPALAAIEGASIAERPVRHSARLAGESKYSALGRIPRVLCDLLTVAMLGPPRGAPALLRPLHATGAAGLALLALGCALGCAAAAAAALPAGARSVLAGPLAAFAGAVSGPALLAAAGCQLLLTGLLGEVLGRAYGLVRRASGRPPYNVKDYRPAPVTASARWARGAAAAGAGQVAWSVPGSSSGGGGGGGSGGPLDGGAGGQVQVMPSVGRGSLGLHQHHQRAGSPTAAAEVGMSIGGLAAGTRDLTAAPVPAAGGAASGLGAGASIWEGL